MKKKVLLLLGFSALLVGTTIFGFIKYIEPEHLDLRKGDCFTRSLDDLAYWTSWGMGTDLQVYDIRILKNGHEIVTFRPIKPDGGYYSNVSDHFKFPTNSYNSTGLVWAYRRDFESMQKYQKGKWVKTLGYSRFSYGEGIRKGVTCNKLR